MDEVVFGRGLEASMDRAFFVGGEFPAMLLTIVARRDVEGETVVMLSLEGVEFFGMTKLEFCNSQ